MKRKINYLVYNANDYPLLYADSITEAKKQTLKWVRCYPKKACFPYKIFRRSEEFIGSFDQKGSRSVELNYSHKHVELPKGKWESVLTGKAKKGDKCWNTSKKKWENVDMFITEGDYQAPYDFYALIRKG